MLDDVYVSNIFKLGLIFFLYIRVIIVFDSSSDEVSSEISIEFVNNQSKCDCLSF